MKRLCSCLIKPNSRSKYKFKFVFLSLDLDGIYWIWQPSHQITFVLSYVFILVCFLTHSVAIYNIFDYLLSPNLFKLPPRITGSGMGYSAPLTHLLYCKVVLCQQILSKHIFKQLGLIWKYFVLRGVNIIPYPRKGAGGNARSRLPRPHLKNYEVNTVFWFDSFQ